MLTRQQVRQIERSYQHSNCVVFSIEDNKSNKRRVFVAETCLKHSKEATIEMVECAEVDETCFEKTGDYYGEVVGPLITIILDDPCADNENCVASIYYEDEVREVFNHTTNTLEKMG